MPAHIAVLLIWLTGILAAQSFEVAVIKPHDPKDTCPNADLQTSGRFFAACWPVRTMLQEAYDVLPSQIQGGPAWIYSAQWDIRAQAAGVSGKIPLAEFRQMLRHLVEDRFKLHLHVDTKNMPGLALVIARKGPKLTPSQAGEFQFDLESGPTLICKKVTMTQLAAWLKGFTPAQRTVIDKTGLTGEYDFMLKWAAQLARTSPQDQPPDSGGPSIFTALQEQLGLRMESRKVPTQILVIDNAIPAGDN